MFCVQHLTLFILFWIYTVCKGSETQGPCKNSFKGCCPGSAWDSQNQKCEQCMPGFSGENCSSTCPYPTYGRDCQELCNCSKDICDVFTGCQRFTTVLLDIQGLSSHRFSENKRNTPSSVSYHTPKEVGKATWGVHTAETSTAKYSELFRGLCLIQEMKRQQRWKRNMVDSDFLRTMFNFKSCFTWPIRFENR